MSDNTPKFTPEQVAQIRREHAIKKCARPAFVAAKNYNVHMRHVTWSNLMSTTLH